MQRSYSSDSSQSMENNEDGTMPQQLIAEGKEQVISVCTKTMFSKLLAAIGPGSEAEFTEIVCGDEGVKVSIKIEMSSEGQKQELFVQSENFETKTKAEENAISLAIKILEQKGLMRVLDFSNQITNFFDAQNTYCYVNEAMGHAEKMLHRFENTLENYRDLALQLEGEEVFEKLHGNITGKVDVYSGLNKFLCEVVKRYSRKRSLARSKMIDLEFQRLKHEERVSEKAKAAVMKEKLKKVFLTSKDVLDEALSYQGFQKAKYINVPAGDSEVNAEVMFKVPYIKKAKHCGTIKKSANGSTSKIAEEEAAYKALMFIEDSYNVRIVGLNHEKRVEAENEQKMLIQLLRNIINIAYDVKEMWDNLVETIEVERGHFNYDANLVYEIPLVQEEIDAFNFCKNEVQKIGQVSSTKYAECLPLIERIHNLAWQLSVLKIKLDIY